MRLPNQSVSFILAGLFALCVCPLEVSAQAIPIGGTLRGETIITTIGNLLATPAGIYSEYDADLPGFFSADWSAIWHPPLGTRIIEMKVKLLNNEFEIDAYLVLLSDGSLYKLRIDVVSMGFMDAKLLGRCNVQGETGSGFKDVFGDAIYAQFYNSLYVSRDNGVSWSIDSAGLGGATISKADIDSLQYVYAATSKGLFWQHPDSSIWHKFDNFPAPRAATVYVNRSNRLIVGVPDSGIYLSADRGQQWTLIPNSKTIRPVKYCDDSSGNLYIITGLPALYKLTAVSGAFTRIDSSLFYRAGMTAIAYNSVSKDSALLLGTSRGLFYSTDDGATWQDGNAGIVTEQCYYMGLSAGQRMVMSTGMGVFSKARSDSLWVNSAPTPYFFGGTPLFTSRSGTIYSYLTGYSSFFPVYYKTTDGGLSWVADSSALLSFVKSGKLFVDESENQYLYSSGWSSWGVVNKRAADSLNWTLDTAGLGATSTSLAYAFASDGNGYLYLGGFYGDSVCLFRKRTTDSVWQSDTAGLGAIGAIWELAADKQGGMFATSGLGVFHRTSSSWISIPRPPQIPATSRINSMVVDSLKRLFIVVNKGVYATADLGLSWRYLGLDSIAVRNLVSFGSETYAPTSNGVYRLNFDAPMTRVDGKSDPLVVGDLSLRVTPNPANPMVTVDYHVPMVNGSGEQVRLALFDVKGRQVALLLNSPQRPGAHTLRWSPASIQGKTASGVYLLKLTVGSRSLMKSLVFMK